jgi:hypothetical protein
MPIVNSFLSTTSPKVDLAVLFLPANIVTAPPKASMGIPINSKKEIDGVEIFSHFIFSAKKPLASIYAPKNHSCDISQKKQAYPKYRITPKIV